MMDFQRASSASASPSSAGFGMFWARHRFLRLYLRFFIFTFFPSIVIIIVAVLVILIVAIMSSSALPSNSSSPPLSSVHQITLVAAQFRFRYNISKVLLAFVPPLASSSEACKLVRYFWRIAW
jgi:hypothetical protein